MKTGTIIDTNSLLSGNDASVDHSSAGTSPVPTLKLAAMAVALLVVPILSRVLDKQSIKDPALYKLAWMLAFAVNVVTVNIPGRFDSQSAMSGKEGSIPWSSLFDPAGWAFSIWGVIYFTEFLTTVYVGLGNEPAEIYSRVAPYWVAGNLFQSAWCLAFRPDLRGFLWIPGLLLALSGASLGLGHMVLTNSINVLSNEFNADVQNILRLVRLPFALHTGWLMVATLLTLNALATVSNISMGAQIAVAFLSAYAAAGAGAVLTLKTRDATLAFTAAWALAAVSTRTKRKVTDLSKAGLVQAVAAEGTGMLSVHAALAITERILSLLLVALGFGMIVPNSLF
jgi:hypothetical protein